MIVLEYVFPHDDLFTAVKQESSLMAARKFTKEGEPLFDQLVFDEAYMGKFRELFFDAQAGVTMATSAYQRSAPPEMEYFNYKDVLQDRDFAFVLDMPDSFMHVLTKPIEFKMRQYLMGYIMYRWLETKLPEEAAIYLRRAESDLTEVKTMLDKRNTPIRRRGSLF